MHIFGILLPLPLGVFAVAKHFTADLNTRSKLKHLELVMFVVGMFFVEYNIVISLKAIEFHEARLAEKFAFVVFLSR